MQDVEQLRQRIPLLDYLQQHKWAGRPATRPQEFVGLCPLHQDTRPSFYVNAHKNLFYCHGCGRGGDLIRFIELSEHLSFLQSLAFLRRQVAPPEGSGVLEQSAAFFRLELHRHPEAVQSIFWRCTAAACLMRKPAAGSSASIAGS